jgi:squalene-hopene/tetraprenyl-beta-curcumene cyclase
VETVFAALFFANEDAPHGKLSADTEKAFDRLWALQIRDGKNQGAWVWNSFDLDPWEMPESTYYGAALAAVATGTAPAGYAARPEIQKNLAALKTYLRDQQDAQPLHNKLILLWADTKLPGVLLAVTHQAIVEEVLQKQQPDGGWTLASLGPWKQHKDAPPAEGSNAYATAITAFTLQQAGVLRSHPAMSKALAWLRSHQDPKLGVWSADSMNKPHKADSMPARFMQDAATGYASLALLGGQ